MSGDRTLPGGAQPPPGFEAWCTTLRGQQAFRHEVPGAVRGRDGRAGGAVTAAHRDRITPPVPSGQAQAGGLGPGAGGGGLDAPYGLLLVVADPRQTGGGVELTFEARGQAGSDDDEADGLLGQETGRVGGASGGGIEERRDQVVEGAGGRGGGDIACRYARLGADELVAESGTALQQPQGAGRVGTAGLVDRHGGTRIGGRDEPGAEPADGEVDGQGERPGAGADSERAAPWAPAGPRRGRHRAARRA